MSRYRFSLDILDNVGTLTVTDIREIMDAALSAAAINVPADKKRSVKVVKPNGVAGEYHAHNGSDCSRCYRAADDEQYEDVSGHFAPVVLPSG